MDEKTVTRIAELEDGQLHCFAGNYTSYRSQKEQLLQQQLNRYRAEQKRIAKIHAEIERLSTWSQRAHKNAAETARKNGVHKGGWAGVFLRIAPFMCRMGRRQRYLVLMVSAKQP